MVRLKILIFLIFCFLKSQGQDFTIKIAKEKPEDFDIADFYNLIGKDTSASLMKLIAKYDKTATYFIKSPGCAEGYPSPIVPLPKLNKMTFGFCVKNGAVNAIHIYFDNYISIDKYFIYKQLKERKFKIGKGRSVDNNDIYYLPYQHDSIRAIVKVGTKKNKLSILRIY